MSYRQAVAMNAAAAAGISDHDGKVFATVYVILGVLLAAISVYIFPVLSHSLPPATGIVILQNLTLGK